MTFVIGDRVLETTTVQGVGTVTVLGAVSGYRAFSAVATANGDTFYYQIGGGTEWEVGLGTRASATTFTRTTVFASSNAGALVNFAGPGIVKEVWMDATAEQLRLSINRTANPYVNNGKIATSISAGAITISLVTAAGNTPSNTDPVFLTFPQTDGTHTIIRVSAALTITIASTATMGFVANSPGRVWVACLLNGTTPELVVRNCHTQFGPGNGGGIIIGFPSNGVISTTGTPGNSARVSYSTTARSNVPFIILGHLDWDVNPLVTPGTWTVPDKIISWSPLVPLPGSIIQETPNTNNTPQSSTGAQIGVVTVSVTRQSKCNGIEVMAGSCSVQTTQSGGQARVSLINQTTSQLLTIMDVLQTSGANANFLWPVWIYTSDHPGVNNPVSYQMTITLIGGTGSAILPATGTNAWILAKELQG